MKSVSNQQLRRRPVYSLKDKIIIDQLASEKFYHISCKNYVVRNWPAHQCAPLQLNVSVADGARVGANLRGVIAG